MYGERLADEVNRRLRAAGIGENDPGLVAIRVWNQQCFARAGLPYPGQKVVKSVPQGGDGAGWTEAAPQGGGPVSHPSLPVDGGR